MSSPQPPVLSRRTLLLTGVPLLVLPSACAASDADAQSGPPPPAPPARFTTAERDRRWVRTRARMREAGLDGLLTPAAAGAEASADTRYLSQRAGWMVLPLDGAPILLVDRREPPAPGAWVSDVRDVNDGAYAAPLRDALRERGLDRARLGIARLSDAPRSLEGDVGFTTLDRLRQACPQARFESATELMLHVKLVRSDEEVGLLRAVTAAGERGLEALRASLGPGVWHKDAWLAAFSALHEATGAPPARLAIRGGAEANTSSGGPMLERFADGQIVNQEMAAEAWGYMAQVNHSMVVGRPPAGWADTAAFCADVFHEMLAWIRPGRRYMDLCRFYAERATARTPGLSPTWVVVHTCGLGDGPRMGAGRSETPDLVIEPSMVFTIKPRIVMPGVSPSVQFGDPVLVTARGAERLGRRRLGPTA